MGQKVRLEKNQYESTYILLSLKFILPTIFKIYLSVEVPYTLQVPHGDPALPSWSALPSQIKVTLFLDAQQKSRISFCRTSTELSASHILVMHSTTDGHIPQFQVSSLFFISSQPFYSICSIPSKTSDFHYVLFVALSISIILHHGLTYYLL